MKRNQKAGRNPQITQIPFTMLTCMLRESHHQSILVKLLAVSKQPLTQGVSIQIQTFRRSPTYTMELQLPGGRFYGHTSRTREVCGFTLTETTYSRGHRLPRHSHQHPYFCFVLRGKFAEFCGKRVRACQPSTLIFHPSGELHSDHFNTDAHCFNLQIDGHLNYQTAQLAQAADFQGGTPAYLATKLYREFRETDEASPLAIEGLALELIAEALRGIKRDVQRAPAWLERAREMLHAQFAEPLTIAYVAQAVSVHPTHLAREFRRRHQRTIGEYIRQLRIEFACRQLSTSDTPLSEIALAAGFFDQSHFSRTFKQLSGMSPATYRRTLRPRRQIQKR
jgi:AraC family transcriptional regulator